MNGADGRQGSSPVRVLGIGGSMRAGSLSLIALEAALRLAAEAGATTRLADVRMLDLPVYRSDRQLADYPPSLSWLLAEVRAADAILLCSPTYHGTVSGAVKNVLDALDFLDDGAPPYLGGKVVGLLALGGGGAINTLNALHHAIRALNGLTIPTVVTVPSGAIDRATQAVSDDAVRRRLARMTGEMIELARRLRVPAMPGVAAR